MEAVEQGTRPPDGDAGVKEKIAKFLAPTGPAATRLPAEVAEQ